jgi:tetratricopeptide (TPR) repeat protein
MNVLVQALKLERGGDPDGAIAAYREALKEAPDSFDAHYGLGRLLDLAGHYDEARTHLSRALTLAPPGVTEQAQRMLGVAWVFAGNLGEAERCFREVFDQRAAAGNVVGAAEEAHELGRVFLESGRFDDAERWYRTGYAWASKVTDRSEADVHLDEMRWAHAQGRIATRRGDTAEADRQLLSVTEFLSRGGNDGEQVQQSYLKGYVAFYRGDFGTAVAELSQADHHDPFILFLLAEAYGKVGQADRAREYYSKVMAATSHGITAALVRGTARARLAEPR